MAEAQVSSGNIGFAGLLTILFVALKLTHVIGWSWWWVLAPLWICAALAVVALGVGVALIAWATRRDRV